MSLNESDISYMDLVKRIPLRRALIVSIVCQLAQEVVGADGVINKILLNLL